MKINKDFIKRCWLYFRNGHSTYLIFAMAFFQFTVITYALAIERLPVLKEIFPSMSIWIAFFVAVYIPSAIMVGHLHMKKVVPDEARHFHDKNPFTNYAAPGKELLYNIPASIIGYENQLKGMRIHNQWVEAWRTKFGIVVETWSQAEIAQIEKLLETTRRLRDGESIADITRIL